MGLGTGVMCERCGEQISYDVSYHGPFEMKDHGDEYDLCGECVRQIRKDKWDKENGF